MTGPQGRPEEPPERARPPAESAATGRAPEGPEVTVIDARGLRCPLPVLRLAQAIAALPRAAGPAGPPAERVIRLLATDPAARSDVAAFVRMRGLRLLAVHEEGEHTAYDVAVGPPPDQRPVSATDPAAEPPEPR